MKINGTEISTEEVQATLATIKDTVFSQLSNPDEVKIEYKRGWLVVSVKSTGDNISESDQDIMDYQTKLQGIRDEIQIKTDEINELSEKAKSLSSVLETSRKIKSLSTVI